MATKKFALGQRSLDNLKGVDKRLQDCVKLAITLTSEDFFVNEGLRTKARQLELFNAKPPKTKTLNSRHLTGHAVDLYPVAVNGEIPWGDVKKFDAIAKAMFTAAKQLGIELRWGGDFNRDGDATTKDAWDKPHFELVDCRQFVAA